MSIIVGFDLGTNSLGVSVRNTALGDNIKEQLEYYSVDIFDSGVGNNKSGEYSYAAERSKGIRQRRLYDVRRRRRWETLKYLIKYGYCPLSMDELKAWMTYRKSEGLFRKYPINNKEFMNWIRLDFDGNGKTDCTPYKLRYDLVNRQFDFTDKTECYRFGRAIFHICQHRGFKSSKGETLLGQGDETEQDLAKEMEKSEHEKFDKLKSFMDENNCKTVGEALHLLERTGMRIRNSEYQAVRSKLKEEIKDIFNYQDGLDIQSDFYTHLISEDKHVGCIFYKNQLRSQKGLIGHCTMETTKPRCPISHPDFEKYRAFSFIANIKIRETTDEEWHPLDLETKRYVYDTCFLSFVSPDFEFKRIRDALVKKLGHAFSYEPNKKGTINYSDKQNVAGCPVSARLKKLLGEDWETHIIQGIKERNSQSKKTPQRHVVTYSAEDIWHYCFTTDEKEDIENFGRNTLKFDDDKIKQLIALWSSIKQGYGMLSRKAIRNITRMLLYGLDNKDAIILAKIPDIVGLEKWERNEDNVRDILSEYNTKLNADYSRERTLCNITNTLIANYKAIEQNVFAYKDVEYQLDASDIKDVDNAVVDYFGEDTWSQMSADEQEPIIEEVRKRYQTFFSTSKREFCKNKPLADYFSSFLATRIPNFNQDLLKKLYHPSMAEFPTGELDKKDSNECRLGSPKLGGIKNPVALRTLHVLRKKVNAMLDRHMIDPETTRVVIETTREINDANMRWAIEQYQNKRKEENKAIEDLLSEFFPKGDISDENYDKANSFMTQGCSKDNPDEIDSDYLYGDSMLFPFTGKKEKVDADRQRLVLKYKLWKQQYGICLYTGKRISFSSLFDDNKYDIEHTLPRSKSFDDSQANLTVCDYYFNRSIKGNKLPTQLANYEEDAIINGVKYTAIKPRLAAWEKKVESLKDRVDYWKAQSRKAQDKNRKDDCIRQRHLWQMEYDFWKDKLMRFKMKEIPQGFRHRQISDTGTISRYAVLYLKTIFHSVDVQKGEVTATFRKILGLQGIEEKKDRSLHSHHAIDAAVLTMIPVAAKREKMLKLFYEREESVKGTYDYERLTNELALEIDSCNFGNQPEKIADIINKNILINQIKKEKTLIPSSKVWRARGKKVLFKQKDGRSFYRTKKGDSIRASLHLDTIYGAIMYPMKDETTKKPIVQEGHFVYDENAVPKMVSRIPVNKLTSLESLDAIVDYSLREDIKKQIERRMAKGKSFNAARDEGLWLLDNNGHEIKVDKYGKNINPIRHIRCFVKAGRGYLTHDKALQLKKHTHVSEKNLVNITDRRHRNIVYVVNEDNCVMLLYSAVVRGKLKRAARILNALEVAELKRNNPHLKHLSDIANEPYYQTITKNKEEYTYYASLIPGTRVLRWENNYEELLEMTHEELSKRLFVVRNFNNKGTTVQPKYTIYLQSHIEAEENNQTVVPQDFNYLIEGYDFEINNLGELSFSDCL